MKMSQGPRARAVEEYKREKKGWYGVVDPGGRERVISTYGRGPGRAGAAIRGKKEKETIRR